MSVIQPVDDGRDAAGRDDGSEERDAIRANNFEFVAEILGLYSQHSGKSTETIIEETLVEKASFLAPHIYAIEVLVAMDSFMSSVERLRKLGVSTNINVLCDSVRSFKQDVTSMAPWLIKESGGALEAFSEDEGTGESYKNEEPYEGPFGDEGTGKPVKEEQPTKENPDWTCPESAQRVQEFIQKLKAIRGVSEE